MNWFIRFGGPAWFRWGIRLATLAGVVGVGFLPYSYDVSGECRVIPASQYGIRAPLDDEIAEIHVREGDWVQAGDKVVTLAGRQIKADIRILHAERDKAQAHLDLLRNGRPSEEIKIAESRLRAAKAKLENANQEYNRYRTLFFKRAVSRGELEDKQRNRETALEEYLAAQEKLVKLTEGYREENIRAAVAEVKRLEEKIGYLKEQLAQTEIYTPIAGRVVTVQLQGRLGQQTRRGDLILVIQDTSHLLVEVAANDAAALDAREGMHTNIRLAGLHGRLLTGKVQRIALTSETNGKFGNSPVRTDREAISEETNNSRTRSGGYHRRVYVLLDEVPPGLSPEMTGYARIVVDEDEVLWRACARPLVRFLRTEVWSWLP